MSGLRDGRNVLHLEALRSRGLDENNPRVRLEQPSDISAHERIVIGCLHTESFEDAIAEIACRPVHAVGDEHVIAGAGGGKQSRRYCCETGWQQGHACAGVAIDLAQGVFERFGGRCAAATIVVTRAMGDLILGSRVEQGRGVIDGRVYETMVGLRVTAGGDEAGMAFGWALRLRRHNETASPLSRMWR